MWIVKDQSRKKCNEGNEEFLEEMNSHFTSEVKKNVKEKEIIKALITNKENNLNVNHVTGIKQNQTIHRNKLQRRNFYQSAEDVLDPRQLR